MPTYLNIVSIIYVLILLDEINELYYIEYRFVTFYFHLIDVNKKNELKKWNEVN